MKFEKLSQQQVWDQVRDSTQHVLQHPGLARFRDWLCSRGVELEQAVFPEIGEVDTDTYSGTLISPARAVLEFYVDCNNPEDADLEDVSQELGPKDPQHPQSDVHNAITMGLIYFDNR